MKLLTLGTLLLICSNAFASYLYNSDNKRYLTADDLERLERAMVEGDFEHPPEVDELPPHPERRNAPPSVHFLLARAKFSDMEKRRASVVSDSDKKVILDKHNQLRASEPASNMVKLSWHEESANLAQVWADELAKSCQIAHDSTEKHTASDFRTCGQNIGKGQRSWEGVVQSWYDEIEMFTYGGENNFHDIGHYTQVVWDNTAYVGCGFAQCSRKNIPIYVCNYCPAGNDFQRVNRPYKKGSHCSECESHKCSSDKKLCEPTSCKEQNAYSNCEDLMSQYGKDVVCQQLADGCEKSCKC